jgi:hypothetical protein
MFLGEFIAFELVDKFYGEIIIIQVLNQFVFKIFVRSL